jgi:TatD DNase family protein
MDRLLLETDSPFMAPVPRRGRDNEPANIPYIAAFHAKIRETTLDEIAKHTTLNAVKLFGLEVDA